MSFYCKDEIIEDLNKQEQFKEFLYTRGFLLTNHKIELDDQYPFYGNWNKCNIGDSNYKIYFHNKTKVYTLSENGKVYFIIGHAYNPFKMVVDEMEILHLLSQAHQKGMEDYWKEESELTGVFCVGYYENENIVATTDCAGMQLVYYGSINGKLFLTSHSKLVSDITDIKQTKYIQKLVSNRFWHYWGTWLPGDLSPFKELKRMNPNCYMLYNEKNGIIETKRFYPVEKINEVTSEEEYNQIINDLGKIMSNNMTCITNKWPDKKISISVTGGRDSMSCLACSNQNYDKLHYFSYISNYDESVDAYAARDILKHLGLKHELYEIPEDYGTEEELSVFKKIMECNNGCIGSNNPNDLRKRLYFTKNPPCDIEVKSWVNEMGRGWYWNKYNKKKFPKYPTPSYWRAMHKVYLTPYLIKETDKVFYEYLNRYYSKSIFDKISWLEMYFWEFAWSGGEGVFLTSEHRVTYDITIPFNNRKYVETMLKVPLEKRKNDCIPIDLISHMEPKIAETGITVHDVSHTSMRSFIVRCYLEIMSKVHFSLK